MSVSDPIDVPGPTTTPQRSAPDTRPRIAVTLGDPNGIGPEVVLKCLADSRLAKYLQPIIVGAPHVLAAHAARLDYREVRVHIVQELPEELPDDGLTMLDIAPGERAEVAFGEVTPDGGRLAMLAVERAVDLCLEGQADAMVTAPISKEAISRAGYDYPGHTEYISERTGADSFTMMMVAGDLRVGLVTGHVAIRDVPEGVTQEAILEKLHIIDRSLRTDFGVDRPRIAVLGLNPHAGDGGVLGSEEKQIIAPAIRRAANEDLFVDGPFPADGYFAVKQARRHDAVLAMFHDQGLVPFKALAFDSGVNYTAGLPIVRTSPDHGTAYNIAGEGKASPGSMRSAIYLAIDVARRRKASTVSS